MTTDNGYPILHPSQHNATPKLQRYGSEASKDAEGGVRFIELMLWRWHQVIEPSAKTLSDGIVKFQRINVEAGMRVMQRVQPARCAVDVSPGIVGMGLDDGATQ